MQILGCLLMSLLAGFFVLLSLGFSILEGLLRFLGFGKRRDTLRDERADQPQPSEPTKKVFSDDEGEYVDFEEV